MNIFVPSAKLVVLKELPFSDYAFPRWQSYASIALVALLSAISATLAPQMHGLPQMSFWVLLGSNFLSTWVLFLMAMFVLRWWMKRGDRWDGEGDMFNLIAASWLVIDLIVYAASMLGARASSSCRCPSIRYGSPATPFPGPFPRLRWVIPSSA